MSIDPSEVAVKLEQAIRTGKTPAKVLYEFLGSGGTYSNVVYHEIVSNPQIVALITSPAGRAWIKKNLDGFLDYLVTLVRQ